MLNFDHIPHGLNRDRRKLMARVVVEKSIDDGSFTYTDYMALGEPRLTDVNEILDSVENDGKTSVQSGTPLEQGVVRLVHVDPNKTITLSATEMRSKPGTFKKEPEKVRKDLGNCADVPDFYPDRLARRLLYAHGWPIRQARDGSKAVGFIVEMRWLEREVKAGTATPDAVAIYEEILTRPSYRKLAGLPDETKQPKTNRGAGNTPPAASAGA